MSATSHLVGDLLRAMPGKKPAEVVRKALAAYNVLLFHKNRGFTVILRSKEGREIEVVLL